MKRPPPVSKERSRWERGVVKSLRIAGLPEDMVAKIRDALRRARIPHGSRADLRAVAALRSAEREGYKLLLDLLKHGGGVI